MHPALILGCLAAVAGMIRLAVYWQLPLPFCVLRTATGIPCPGCGCGIL